MLQGETPEQVIPDVLAGQSEPQPSGDAPSQRHACHYQASPACGIMASRAEPSCRSLGSGNGQLFEL